MIDAPGPDRAATAVHCGALGAAMSPRHVCSVLAVCAAFAGAQAPADLEQLAKQLEAAHRTADAAPVTAFVADLRLKELAREAEEHRGELELHVEFREWQNPETGRPWPLIRYRQVDSARAVEQGRDRVSFWSVVDGKAQDMMAREMETDRQNCRRNLKLAQQMIRFLDPAGVLRGLEQPTAVVDEDLQLGRTDKLPCRVVSGRLAAFPLRQQSGDNAAVAAKAWVAQTDPRLIALQVTPLDADGKPNAGAGEFLRFENPRLLAGRLVPMRVVHFAVTEDGRRRAQVEVEITLLDLGRELALADFDRPK